MKLEQYVLYAGYHIYLLLFLLHCYIFQHFGRHWAVKQILHRKISTRTAVTGHPQL